MKEAKKYFLDSDGSPEGLLLRETGDTPFFHHVAALAELCEADQEDRLRTHHFNMLRTILEKTASFHGYKNFSACFKSVNDDNDDALYSRLINVLSHGNHTLFNPVEMPEENKRDFRAILRRFIDRHPFNPASLPENWPQP